MNKKRLSINLIFVTSSIALFFMLWSHQTKEQKVLFQEISQTKEPKMKPNDWFSKQKTYPNATFSYEHYLHALQQTKTIQKSTILRNAQWEAAGPTNIGGRITDIVVDPNSTDTWYIGAATGGIFKTTDAGANWQHVFTDVPVISIGALAIDPSNTDILYAGTGEANSSSQSFIGNGIYKTIDGGESWQHLGLEQSAYFGRVLIDHSNSNRIYAAACGTLFGPNETRGIYRSTDGGEQWEQVLFVNDSTAAVDIVQHPTNPDILYASMWERQRGLIHRRSHGASSGIYKTMDGGNNWTLLTEGLPNGEMKGRIGLAIAQNNSEIVYAFIDVKNGSNLYAKVYKTINGGENWQQTNDENISSMNSTFGWYFGQIRIDPTNDNRIYMMGVDLYTSSNGGNSYDQLAGYYNMDEIYVDHHAMYINPTTGLIINGNDGGLYTSTNFGTSWTKINNLPLTQFYSIDFDYLQPNRLVGGTQDNSSIRTATGALDDWEVMLGGDGFQAMVDYTNSDIIYAEYQNGQLHRSDDGGDYFSSIVAWYNDRTNWSSPYVMHPTTPETLYFGTYRVWKTTNRGDTWTPISDDLTRNLTSSGFSTITTLAISALNPNYLLAGSDDGRVHISNDGGNSWVDISEGIPNRWVTRVAFDPFENNTIYATVSGFRWNEAHAYVYKSENLGQTWNSIGGNLPELPVNVLVADPDSQNRLIIGTDVGVFITQNGGESWSSLMQGMPNVPIYDMKIHRPTRTLLAGTYGNSAYKLNLDQIVGIDPTTYQTVNSGILRSIYPNPVLSNHQKITIEYFMASSEEYALKLYDIQGKQAATLASGFSEGGANTCEWNAYNSQSGKLTVGIYILHLETKHGIAQQKLIVN
ncbi:MAG: T9SS type A sorting domain-containing protein [Salinivirgaceae bacterium]|nr:T9SS type A sorting domain-containing protein [Salinivirgaceae bacterium]